MGYPRHAGADPGGRGRVRLAARGGPIPGLPRNVAASGPAGTTLRNQDPNPDPSKGPVRRWGFDRLTRATSEYVRAGSVSRVRKVHPFGFLLGVRYLAHPTPRVNPRLHNAQGPTPQHTRRLVSTPMRAFISVKVPVPRGTDPFHVEPNI